jgi:hypothetical protein
VSRLVATLGLIFGIGCAPTSIAPSVIRLEAPEPEATSFRLGLRSGPRVPLAEASIRAGAFRGDNDSFHVPEWSAAYDFALTLPLGRGVGFHAGVQAEFFYPIPMAALGGWVGFSWLFRVGPLAFAPAIAARGASDFGLVSVGGPANLFAGDAAVTISYRVEDRVWIGIIPFASQGFAGQALDTQYWFAGGCLMGRVGKVEILGGWGRVWVASGPSWNVPLIGIRAGDN